MYLTQHHKEIIAKAEAIARPNGEGSLTSDEVRGLLWLLNGYRSELEQFTDVVNDVTYITLSDGTKLAQTDDRRWVILDERDIPILNAKADKFVVVSSLWDARIIGMTSTRERKRQEAEDE